MLMKDCCCLCLCYKSSCILLSLPPSLICCNRSATVPSWLICVAYFDLIIKLVSMYCAHMLIFI
uniref:Uncharacterized protein n=1 Tax=Rhizophora mucronata TaxID=61149 RepID=A0A2P2MXZ0_RHIMU